MYCQSCGEQIEEGANFCESCGQSTSEKPEDVQADDEIEISEHKWSPRYPVLSVFSSFMLIWAWAAYDSIAFVVLAIPVIPRVRLYFVPWIRETAGIDLTTQPFITVIGVFYAVLVLIAVFLMGGYAANDAGLAARPLTWLFVWIVMVLIAGAVSAGIVGVVRLIRRADV